MKATEQYFPVVLFIMLYKVVLTFESADEILKFNIQMKATEQYFPVILFIMLYKVVLTLKSVDEILKRDQPNESYWAVDSCGTLYYAVQGGLTFESLGEILKCAMQLKATEQYFPLVFLMVVQKMVLIFCTWIIYTKPFLVRCELSVSSKW